eukprot:5633550-Prymnesium_polylepis.1
MNRSTRCLGGELEGRCAPQYHGPECQLCVEASRYLDDDSGMCLDCPDATRPTLVAFALCVGAGPCFIALWRAYSSPPRALRGFARSLRRARLLVGGIGWSKPKIAVAFYQIAAVRLACAHHGLLTLRSWRQVSQALLSLAAQVLETTYDVPTPSWYTDAMKAFNWIEFDWARELLPVACLGGFHNRMLLTVGASPTLVVLALLVALGVARFRQQPLMAALWWVAPFALIVIFVSVAN